MGARLFARWLLLHGGSRALMWNARRKGDLGAHLILDPDLGENPYPGYEKVRAAGRLVRESLVDVTVDHEVCSSVLRDSRFGVAVFDAMGLPRPLRWLFRVTDLQVISGVDPPGMLAVNPPDHTRYRKLVSKAFTPRAIEALRPRIEAVTDELLDGLAGRDFVDIAEEFAGQLPVTVIAEILGVPVDMREQFLAWGNAAAPILDMGLSRRTHRAAMEAIAALNQWFEGHFEQLRRKPGDDMLSRLVNLVDDGDRLAPDELMATAMLLLGAGFETTVNLIGNGAVLLLDHPDQLQALRDDPSLWPNAVEEVLRFDSPVQSTARAALEDVEVMGIQVPKGRVVATLIGGANRDPRVFADPDRFDVRRENARDHLAFSSGVHFCLGASLARMEGEIALRRLFERFPDLRLAGAPHRRPMRTLHGFDRLPVSLGRTVAREVVPA